MPKSKIQLKERDYNKIRDLASRGVRQTEICRALNISYDTWLRIKDEDEKAIQVFEEAREIEHDKLFSVVFEKAMKGDTVCALFLLKCKYGYQEGAPVANANQVNVQITLPGAKSETEYEKLIEVSQNEKATENK